MSTPENVQQSATTPAYSSPPITIILTILILAFFFIGFFSLYFCRCLMQNLVWTWQIRHNPNGTPVGPAVPANLHGLDPKIIQSFPTFTYSTVKDYRKEKYGLECAICLVEFGSDDVLRLLTLCCHVFHQECIDLWLESHNTCPVCRRSLDSVSPEKSPLVASYNNNISSNNYNNNNNSISSNVNAMHDINENSTLEDSFVISIKDDDEDGKNEREPSVTVHEEEVEGQHCKVEKFSRSHSTGHSIVIRNREEGGGGRKRGGGEEEEEDRFTLRLPEHVKAKIVKGHNLTRSCINFGEFKNETTASNGGFGEVSGLSGGDHINRV